MSLIELLKDYINSQKNDKRKLERCLNASKSDLEELSQLLRSSPDIHIPTLQNFVSYICNSWTTPSIKLKNYSVLSNFTLSLITIVIMENLHHSDISGFGELFHNCIKLLRLTGYNKLEQTMKNILNTILDADGMIEILVSSISGRLFLKYMLVELKMVDCIEQERLHKAVDVVAALVEECTKHKHKEFSHDLLESFYKYKACEALLETCHSNEFTTLKNLNLVLSTAENQQHLKLLGMFIPQRSSDLSYFLRALEKQKVDLLQYLIEFSLCISCRNRILIYFYPDKYNTLKEESIPSFHLPFEFNDDDKLGPWDVLLSENAIKDMQQLTYSVTKLVMKKLGRISSGEWGKHKLQNLAWNDHELRMQTHGAIPVYEIKLPDNDGLRILWSIDYGFSIRSYLLTQLVKVWTVTTDMEKIHNVVENLSLVHKVYTFKQSHRCVVEQIGNDDIICPVIFDEDKEETKTSQDNIEDPEIDISVDDERLLNVHSMLVTNKFTPLSTNLFKSLVLGGLNYTFQVSKKEYEIINNPTSAIIIGRSGTGKTTCIMFRQIASYLNNQLCEPSSLHRDDSKFCKKQIFITVSKYLCRRVKDSFDKLRESAMLAGKKMTMAQFHEFKRNQVEERDKNFKDIEEDDIPNSFRQLKDDNFPLFITYDKFSKMLQGTYGINNLDVNNDSYDDDDKFLQKTSSIKNKHFVEKYENFERDYWRRLDDYSKRQFDCELVYSEFSVIKGLNPDVNCLSREDYRNISTKKYPAFCYSRDEIYDLFQRYEDMKAAKNDYDSTDRTLAILRCAKAKSLGGPHIHEVYIDECQDNQIVDLALILKLFNRADSIYFAGDIAQCIARGSSFRFQDLSVLVYQWECDRAKENYNRDNIKPKTFELNINYRSHNGVLKLAASVVDLISNFFPNSIDKLSREVGEVGGPRPIFFEGFQKDHFKIPAVDENTNNIIEFGAEQVIIVRDEKAIPEIKKRIGDAGQIMTVFDTKGMEFNDVILYNFFTDSPAGQKWRLILSSIPDYSEGIPTFIHEKHYILSSEFKHLYVAVTRARQRIWIFEEDDELSKPIREYWDYHKLIRKIKLSKDDDVSKLAKKSSPDEWDKKGHDFFEQEKYKQAIFCFTKSGNGKWSKLANAHYLLEKAKESINDLDEIATKNKFVDAAKEFLDCSMPNRAASCYQYIDMYEDAGDVYSRWEMPEHAARCYRKAKKWLKAGKYFIIIKKYLDAIDAYKNGSHYEELIKLIKKYRKEIGEEIFRENIEYIKKQYRDIAISDGEFEKAIDVFIRLTYNDNDIVESLQFLLDLCGIDTLNHITNTNRSHLLEQKEDRENMLSANANPNNDNAATTKNTITKKGEYTSTLEKLLSKKNEIVTMSQTLENFDKLRDILEVFKLYSAYLEKDINGVHDCIQFSKCHKNIVFEFHATSIWLYLTQSDIRVEHWHKRLQYLLRLCELSFSFINSYSNINNKDLKDFKNFENIFFINEVTNSPRKRQIPFGSPLLTKINNMNSNMGGIDAAEEKMNYKHIYNKDDVYQKIAQFLALYVFEFIQNVNQKGMKIPDISSQICDKLVSCQNKNCKNHHVISTPLILHRRLKLALLQYSLIQQLDTLCNSKLLEGNQFKEAQNIQKWWTENLIEVHFRHQSPQTSCPEIIYIVLAKLPKYIRDGFVNLAYKIWSLNGSKNGNNFRIILKCMFVFQQLQHQTSIDKFYLEMSKITMLSQPIDNAPIVPEISFGKKLSLFFFFLYSNQVTHAILHANKLIHYVINNIQLDKRIESDLLSDLVSFMEFTISLVFTTSSKYCNFCLPRAYLVNYFEAFTIKPLISNKSTYNNEDYLAAINYSFDQIQRLLDLLICKNVHSTIILRLIRILVLIGLNEPILSSKIFNLFKHLNDKISSIKADGTDRVFSIKVKEYLEGSYTKEKDIERRNMEEKDIGVKVTEKDIEYLVNVLNNDLKETGCDSLVIVHHYQNDSSRFSYLEKHGIMKLTYNSIEGFNSALQQIILSEFTKDNTVFEEVQDIVTDYFNSWIAARKIQIWFRRIRDRRKFRKLHSILNNIYNAVTNFCKGDVKKEKKQRIYNILLRGKMVDVAVKLIELQRRMSTTKNEMQNSINNCSSNTNKLKHYLELRDNFKDHKYDEKVKMVLESLSVIKNSTKHREANIKWLENKVQESEDIIRQVQEWLNKCHVAMNSNEL